VSSGAIRKLFGVLLFAAALVPIVGALDLLAERRVATALLGLLAGGLLAAGAARLMLGGRTAARETHGDK
jgi:hypothetical protein